MAFIWSCLLTLAVGAVVTTVIWKRCTRKNGKWPVITMLPSLLLNRHRLHDFLTEILTEGDLTVPFASPGFNVMLTSHPANIEHVLKKKFHTYIKPEFMRQSFMDFLGESIITANGQLFNFLSRVAVTCFSSASFRKVSESTLNDLVNAELLLALHHYSMSTTQVDMVKIISEFSFHLICKAGLGVDPVGITGSDVFLNAFETAADMSMLRLVMPMVIWKSMWVLNVGSERKLKSSIDLAHKWIEKAMDSRKYGEYDMEQFKEGFPMDIVSASLLHAPELQEKPRLRESALSLILAGKDTVTSALSWFFWAVCEYPEMQQKIYEEVSSIAKRKPGHEMRVFAKNELREMQYLHATLSEVMRLYPPVPFNFVEPLHDDVLPDGSFIKKGTTLCYSVYAYGRDEAVWGTDAGEFRPERWMKEGKIMPGSESRIMAFSLGPRRCLGRDFGYSIMKSVGASIILRFRLRLAPDAVVAPKFSISLGTRHGLPIIVEKRKNLN